MKQKPNVLLIVCDALRPDFLSSYGTSTSHVTPGFDQIATDGTLFENAFTVGRNTPISHGVMFTGRYPSETGLVGGFRSIPDDTRTLAEHLNNHGYDTFGISRKTGRMSSDFGHDRGFEEFYEPDREDAIPNLSLNYLRKTVQHPKHFKNLIRTLLRGRDKLTKLKFDLLLTRISNADDPFFGFINQITTHGPYRPPRHYRSQSVPSFSCSKLYITELIADHLGIQSTSIDHPGVQANKIITGTVRKDHNFNNEEWLNKKEITIIRQWYGALVDYLDKQLLSFIQSLKEMGKFNNTVVILTSDHGEYLGEHQMIGHSHFLYDEVMHIPLIISGPGVSGGRRRSDPVSLIDLYNTVCDLCNISSPQNINGHSVFGKRSRDAVFAEYGIRNARKMGYDDVEGEMRQRIEAGLKCIRTEKYKYTIASDGEESLYKLPEEEIVNDPSKELVASFRRDLFNTLEDRFLEKLNHDEIKVDKKSLQNLRELGYLE